MTTAVSLCEDATYTTNQPPLSFCALNTLRVLTRFCFRSVI